MNFISLCCHNYHEMANKVPEKRQTFKFALNSCHGKNLGLDVCGEDPPRVRWRGVRVRLELNLYVYIITYFQSIEYVLIFTYTPIPIYNLWKLYNTCT